jgi:hypothetical protein
VPSPSEIRRPPKAGAEGMSSLTGSVYGWLSE